MLCRGCRCCCPFALGLCKRKPRAGVSLAMREAGTRTRVCACLEESTSLHACYGFSCFVPYRVVGPSILLSCPVSLPLLSHRPCKCVLQAGVDPAPAASCQRRPRRSVPQRAGCACVHVFASLCSRRARRVVAPTTQGCSCACAVQARSGGDGPARPLRARIMSNQCANGLQHGFHHYMTEVAGYTLKLRLVPQEALHPRLLSIQYSPRAPA